jgi:2-keto-4-pentenoate hydratase/2-oxohepta-3-ene-1,7-dioic acid hydratase in catechol pathway
MKQTRRNVLKGAGALAAAAVTGALSPAAASPSMKAEGKAERGMAHGLTLLSMRHGSSGDYRLGVKTEKGILDVPEAAKQLHMHAPETMDELLQNEDGPALNALVEAGLKSSSAKKAFVKEETIEYGPLLSRPSKIVCVGLNYRKHAAETGQAVPKEPILFNKYATCLNRHNGTVKLPVDLAKKFDYEVELVIVIGKEAKNVVEADALKHAAGYATGNDFTARDLQYETGGQWMIGKAVDQFAPIGPYMLTADLVDPDNLKLETRVNGETRQSSSTSDMIANCRHMISYISRYMTLKPGDIIFTGTPEGVIQGKPKDKQVWLKPGDKIACSLEKLGELKFELV